MLSTLHIENIAVIEQAEIAFDSGFNVLTGETGAGKSIVIDAISAILGERASREMIRTGEQKAFVSAIFSGVPELPWFAENQIPYEPELGISREIFADGKNSCRVSGKPVTVSTLRKLGVQLIQIHGQNDSQQLFDEATHIGYLDLPMTQEEVDGCTIYTVNDGDLVACFTERITDNVVAAMADKTPLRVLFRDSCFAQDDQKINIYEQFKQLMDWTDDEAFKNIKVI